MLDCDQDIRTVWLEEARREAKQNNPLIGYCKRIYFQRDACLRRNGTKKKH